MIIYIHGFAGSGRGSKATTLREKLGTYDNILAPSLSHVPSLAIDTLCQLIENYQKHEDVHLVGSSLGGYYSIFLAQKYKLKAALINPAITPCSTLRRMLGRATNYADGSYFEWTESHLEMLAEYKVVEPNKERFLLLSQTGDELLDYRDGVSYLDGAKQIIVEGGDHSFIGIEEHLIEILDFFELQNKADM